MLHKFLAPSFWSSDIKKVNPEVHKKMIVVQPLNYGSEKATDWLFKYYGKKEIKKNL
jgi:hypothetical protein